MKIKAGQLLSLDEGCYSDYGIRGFFVVLQEFDPVEIKEAIIAKFKEQGIRYGMQDAYVTELVRLGLVLEIQYNNIHLGDYSDFDYFRVDLLSGEAYED